MAIIIMRIEPKMTAWPDDKVAAHLAINNFHWQNDQNPSQAGVSSRAFMFDWIVNKQGKAFVKRKSDSKLIPIFGANAPTGQYIRSAEDGKWTDDLLDVEDAAAK